MELLGTSNPNQKGEVHNLGPCRNLTCPSDFVSQEALQVQAGNIVLN